MKHPIQGWIVSAAVPPSTSIWVIATLPYKILFKDARNCWYNRTTNHPQTKPTSPTFWQRLCTFTWEWSEGCASPRLYDFHFLVLEHIMIKKNILKNRWFFMDDRVAAFQRHGIFRNKIGRVTVANMEGVLKRNPWWPLTGQISSLSIFGQLFTGPGLDLRALRAFMAYTATIVMFGWWIRQPRSPNQSVQDPKMKSSGWV